MSQEEEGYSNQIMISMTEKRLTPSPTFYVDFVHYQRFIQEKDAR